MQEKLPDRHAYLERAKPVPGEDYLRAAWSSLLQLKRGLTARRRAIEFYSIPASQHFRVVAVSIDDAKKPAKAKA